MKATLFISEPVNDETGSKTGVKNYTLYISYANILVSEYDEQVHLRPLRELELLRQYAESEQEVEVDYPDVQVLDEWIRAERLARETTRRVIGELVRPHAPTPAA